jgi:nitrate/TMAO reductase-like tetraheme cytochrome c subunit
MTFCKRLIFIFFFMSVLFVPIKDVRSAVFPLSEKCKKCHERVYDEWVQSSMSQSINSPVFKITFEEYLSKERARDAGYCMKCHAPQTKVNPEIIEDLILQVKKGKVVSDGIGCAQCHLIKEVNADKQDIKIRYELGRTLFGPYNDPVDNLVHGSEFQEAYKKSDFCLACHQFKILFSDGEHCCDSFDGWKKSKAKKEGKECQSCHMKERLGPSADEEKPRKIASHDFPGKYGDGTSDAVKMDIEKVLDSDQLQVTVLLQSLVPHNFPGGHPAFAQVFLEVLVRNQDYKTIFSEKRFYRRVF